LACVAGVEAVNMIRQPEFLQRATEVGKRMREHLLYLQNEFEIVGDVRGLGPMLAIELVRDREPKEPANTECSAVNLETLKRGLITIRAGLYSNCVRFLPPLNITDDQIDEGMSVVREALRVVSK
jgi:4-aminobutyrate aminotransferase / (S)-3-amino-2-methylpropionate transaminase / 5-aminovalerate transaminase